MDTQDHILTLAVKKITGEATAEEIQELDALLKENPDAIHVLQLLFAEWSADEQISRADAHRLLAKIMARIGYAETRRNQYIGISNSQWQKPKPTLTTRFKTNITMIRTYIKLAYRNLIKDKAYSIINISGLAIGLASSILILLWVQGELSYDQFHKNAPQLYRLAWDTDGITLAGSPTGMAAALKAQIPAVKNTTRVDALGNTHLFEADNKKFVENRVLFVDPNFLDVFSFSLEKGDRATALKQVNGVLITEATAKKYFGNQNPIGKFLKQDHTDQVVVTGVLANPPVNSHLQFDFIMPMAALFKAIPKLERLQWAAPFFYTYIQLDKNYEPTAANLSKLEKQVSQIYHKQEPEVKSAFRLQPMTQIHLSPAAQVDSPGHGNALYVKIFLIVAILILAVACINFMNLATARSARRAKEIGLRKVAGAQRIQLIFQFLSESVFIAFLSLFLALWIVVLFLPVFNDLAGKQLSVNLTDAKLWLSLLGIALLTGVISGSYPALFLSGFNPVKVLKGNVKSMGGNLLFRHSLVVTQFVVSVVLLVGTVVIYKQLKYIKDRNPGFNKASLLYMDMDDDMQNKESVLRNELKRNPLTSDFAITSELPVNLEAGAMVSWPGKDPRILTDPIPILNVSENFLNLLKIKLTTGRFFSESITTDSNDCVVNEKMLKLMGIPNARAAIGKQVKFGRNTQSTIIGVVKDFNFKPVQSAIEPLIFRLSTGGGTVVIRTKTGTTTATIKALEKISKQLNPGYPFSFGFVDQQLDKQYRGEQQMGNIFKLFAAIGIFISCLGLYGLSAFVAEQRTKEVGVRKVLGASVFNLVYLLSSGITRLILVAICIAVPVSWYAVNSWLTTFAYHIDVSWLIFFIASATALSIAWLTVSYESIRAASVNPIKSLRTE
ncbi:ABC transporter permease [Mucilaginibacter dorajii]|uniref:ABC transporter permease n=1 Tax=Mucilaginibacter dorajii TaxID=692994 RepID=A0ABP7Q8M2_9SPHI|nr:ABC transporter permease [Mucilaginibacter dorajii]MCS3737489.1 ABC-type antimicrobial peptide transport system permease subunit [Mucilaginibacter dorajii]